MADSLDVNFDVVDLACNLLLFSTREEYTRAVAYDELEDKVFEKATQRWGNSDEDTYFGFIRLFEGINVLCYGTTGNEEYSVMEKRSDSYNDERDKMLEDEEKSESFQPNTKRKDRKGKIKRIFCCSSSKKDKNVSTKPKSEMRSLSDQEIELSSLSCVPKDSEKSLKENVDEQGSIDGLDFFNDGFRVTICEPELDLTTTEDEEDNTAHARERIVDNLPNGVHTESHKSQSFSGNKSLIATSRFLEARAKFQEVDNRLKGYSLGRRQISLSNRLRFFRLALACAMLMTVNNPKSGLEGCRNLIGQLNSLKSVKCLVTKALGVPSGLRQRVHRKICGQKWRKMLEKVHFVNYMFWQWMLLWKDQPRTGLELEIPVIDADFGAVQPVDDWKLRDKCQTCVEFEQKMAHACTLAVNSKDQLVLIDANNIVTTYTLEGKQVMSFRASTRRHPHSRWIIGLDEMDNIYIGSTLGIRYDKRRPLSVFSPAGCLVSEPELCGIRGRYNLYTVSKKGLILVLTIGTSAGNVVSVHRHQTKELVASFRVREIRYPRHFTTSKDTVIIGGTTSGTESKEFAFQVFDHSGQQLFFFKPEVEFQTCGVDPWTGNIVLVNINKRRDYRYYMCDTVVLTGEMHILSQAGETVQSGVKLRWPFGVVAGVTVLRCGLVALVTVDDPYYAIHII